MINLSNSLIKLKKVLLCEKNCNFVTTGLDPIVDKGLRGYKYIVTDTPQNDNFVTAESQAQQGIEDKGYKITKVTVKNDNIISLSKEYFYDFFEERAGIFEHDGNLKRYDAEVSAYDECICKWLDVNNKSIKDTKSIGLAISYLTDCGIKCPAYKEGII